MIASLTGLLRRKEADYLIVDVAGVGYEVQVPRSTYERIPEAGEVVSLHIHTHLREDSLSLFGFLTSAEKDLFLLLMGVSGIGPKLALAILSRSSIHDISCAIQASDDSALCAVPGIGKKTAARMILELKDKIAALASTVSPGSAGLNDEAADDAVSALVNLGYKKPAAEDALRKVRQGRPDLAVEALIREALGILSKR